MLPLDVTVQSTVTATVERVLADAGHIDVLVNCAGFGIAGSIEDTTPEEALEQFETNFFGVHRMCRAVLPDMRRRTSGRIITVSSIGGLIALPYQGAYAATKFALEGLMEALRMELRPFGISVVLIEPADFVTAFTSRRRITADAADSSSAYTERFRRALDVIESDETGGSDPEVFAKLVERVVTARNPRLRYTVGEPSERLAAMLKRVVPGRVFEPIIRRHYRT